MGTDRKTARDLAQTTLAGLGVFEAVIPGVPGKFAGRSPVAVITSRSLNMQPLTRGAMEETSGITVSIYVRHDPSADESRSPSEDQLDDLSKAVALALHATDVFYVSESSASPESGNLRDVDRNGVLYRVERIPLTVLDESER